MSPRARQPGVLVEPRTWIFCFFALVVAGAGCAGRQLAVNVDDVRHIAQEARDNGAMRCAPRELALADTNAEFATRELDEGDYFRSRAHLRIAEDNAREALRLSPRDKCAPSTKAGDRDGDGIADDVDKCPNEAGPADNGGCPKKYEHIVVTEEKIELKQKVFFETDKAVIMSRSHGLLAEIANVLQTRPSLRLRIEGHTDARGTPKRNMILSGARADAVRIHLVGLGIDGARLEARGYGSEQPIETNRTIVGRERNRRVEFVITQQ